MAEFPSFGRHCSFAECHRLDFLPIRCDACEKQFCADHYSYEAHSCKDSGKKDVQVPVCPLCGKVVPVARGQLPDEPMNRHIESGCISDPAHFSRGQIYKYRCSVHGCRKRELIPMKCEKCKLNFCLTHRFPVDHECGSKVVSSSRISPAGQAAIARQIQNKTSLQNTLCARIPSSQSPFSMDEAYARALHLSLNGEMPTMTLEEADRAYAEELQKRESQSVSA